MAYASIQNIVDRYGEDALVMLTDRDNDDAIDTQVVEQALQDATAEINTWIGARYSLPLMTNPEVLVFMCVDIVMYRLSPDQDVATEERRKRYEDAISMLKNIVKGSATLGIPENTLEEVPQEPMGIYVTGRERMFGRRR